MRIPESASDPRGSAVLAGVLRRRDLDAALAKVDELGGVKHAGPIDIQVAKIAIVADPQGAVFALYDGELEP